MDNEVTDIQKMREDAEAARKEDRAKIKELSAQLEALQAERDAAAATLRSQAFELAGFPVGDDGTPAGPAKLLFERYDGEPTRDAVLEAAKAYDIAPPSGGSDAKPSPEAAAAAMQPAARAISAASQGAAAINAASVPAAQGHQAEYEQQLHAAEDAGDWRSFLALEVKKDLARFGSSGSQQAIH